MLALLTVGWVALTGPAYAFGEPELAIPARSPQAMRVYRADHLRVVPVTSWTYHNQSVGFSSYSGYGWSSFVALGPTFATPQHEWRIAKGATLIGVPKFLELSQQVEMREEVLRKIKRNKTYTAVFGGVAVASAAALLGGLVTESNATSDEAYIRGSMMSDFGSLGLAVGLIAGSIPGGRAKRLASQPSASMTPDEAEAIIRQHNEALRISLGLTASEAFEIEQGLPHRDR